MSRLAREYPDDFERREAEWVEDSRQSRIDAMVARWRADQKAVREWNEGEDR